MRKLAVGIFSLAVLVVTAPAIHAEEGDNTKKDMQAIYEECGLGGLLFPTWPVGASVSNFTWDFGSTASTSGLTTPNACKGGKPKLAMYIYKSYDSIEQNLAKGDGKYLDMLALLSNSLENKDAFIQDVRTKFREEVAKDGYSSMSRLEKAQLMYTIVEEQTQS